MIRETVKTVGTVFAFSPLGMPLLVHGAAGLLVGTVGLNLINGVINDVKGAGDVLQQEMGKPTEWEPDKEPE